MLAGVVTGMSFIDVFFHEFALFVLHKCFDTRLTCRCFFEIFPVVVGCHASICIYFLLVVTLTQSLVTLSWFLVIPNLIALSIFVVTSSLRIIVLELLYHYA